MIFVDRIAFGGVLSLSKEIGKIRHSTVTLLLTTITEVLTDAHMHRPARAGLHQMFKTQTSDGVIWMERQRERERERDRERERGREREREREGEME